jgi:hypothetical protein
MLQKIAIMKIIYKDKTAPNLKQITMNWRPLEYDVVSKYGEWSKEKIWAENIIYYLKNKDWTNYGKCYKPYFDKVISLGRNIFNLNNLSWAIFENVNNIDILKSAVSIARSKRDAIQWEQKALKLSNNRDDIKRNYERMTNKDRNYKY